MYILDVDIHKYSDKDMWRFLHMDHHTIR